MYSYTGTQWDLETAVCYYRHRVYHAGLGRFGSRDPVGYEARDENLYRYVRNAPLIATDPTGKKPPAGLVPREFGDGYSYEIPLKVWARRYGYWSPGSMFGVEGFVTDPLAWGCGGLAAIRADAPLGKLPHFKEGTRCCKTKTAAFEELERAQQDEERKDPILIAITLDVPARSLPPDDCPCDLVPSDIDISPAEHRNFLSWLGLSSSDWFWEDAESGVVNDPSANPLIRHRGTIASLGHTYYCIVPRAWNPSPPLSAPAP